MAVSYVPVEWTGPPSARPAIIGGIWGMFGALAATLSIDLFGPHGPGAPFTPYVIPLLIALPAVTLIAIVVPTSFPMPAPRIGVFPAGVVFDYGLRKEPIYSPRLHLSGSRLYVHPNRFGPTTQYRLTPYQTSRVRYVVPGIGA